MPWPQTTEYNEAIQNLRTGASDEELRRGEPVVGPSGVPRPFSGNFADVYKVHCPQTGNTWAVKCFTREVPGLRERYREISAHLEHARLPFMVDFQYVEPGIQAGGLWVPFLKMRWVEGLTLNQFVSDSLDKPKTLRLLLQLWAKLAARLREANVAHADLQHGNVLLVPAGDQGQLALRLIDYDGMYVPALSSRKSGELGHPCYQHPQRLREGIYSLEVDRFSHLAIYCAIQCLIVGRRPLWKRFDNDDNLLFREADFRKPRDSEALRAVWSLADPEARTLAGRLVLATQVPLAEVPLLSEVLSNGSLLPLSAAEERQVDTLLKAGGAAVGKGLTIKPLSLGPLGQAGAGVRAPVSETRGQSDAWWAAGAALPTPGESGTVPAAPDAPQKGLSPRESVKGRGAAKSRDEAPSGIKALLAGLETRFGLPPAASLTLCGVAVLVMVFALVFALSGPGPTAQTPETEAEASIPPAAPERRELRTLSGHTGAVQSVAFSPDGRTVASGSDDGTVKLWNAATGQELHTLTAHSNNVRCVAFSPDGRTLASASDDATVKLWHAELGQELHTLRVKTDRVFSLAISPDGRTLAIAGDDRKVSVWLWDVETGRGLRSLTGHGGYVRSLAFSADGRTLASGSHDQSVKLWDARTAQELRTLTGHRDDVLSVAFSPDGGTLASASEDRSVRLWDVESGHELRTLTAHSRYVLSVAFAPDGRTLAGTSRDRSVRLWDALSGQELAVFAGHTREVCCAAFSSDGRTLATGSFDTTVRLWPVEPLGPLIEPPAPAPSGGSAPRPASMGPLVVEPPASAPSIRTQENTSLASEGDAPLMPDVRTLTGHSGYVFSVAFSPDGRTLASGSYDKTVKLWDLAASREMRTLSGHGDYVRSVAFSPDGRMLASASEDRTVKLWDAGTGRELRTLTGHRDYVLSVAFSPDGRTLASAGEDQTVKLWDTEGGQELRTLTGHSGYVFSVAFSPKGRVLASGGRDRTVKLWDGENGQELRTLTGHRDYVRSVAFSPDGRIVASASEDRTVRLWDVETGESLRTLAGHGGYVYSLAFSPNGRVLASGSLDGTVKLWDPEAGQELRTLTGDRGTVLAVAFSPDGRTLASPGEAGAVKLWFAPLRAVPFWMFPRAIDLPERGEAELGQIDTGPETRWDLTLVDGDEVLSDAKRQLSLERTEAAGKPIWPVRVGAPGATPTEVAQFWRDGQSLHFGWTEGTPSGAANALRLCRLTLRAGRAEARDVSLAAPQAAAPVALPRDTPASTSQIPLAWLPQSSKLRVQVTHVIGLNDCEISPGEPVELDTHVTLSFTRTHVRTKTPHRMFALDAAFSVKDATTLNVEVAPSDERSAGALKSLPSRGLSPRQQDQLDLALKQLQNPQALRGNVRQSLEGLADRLSETAWRADFHEALKTARLHYRVFAKVGDRLLEIASTAATAGPARDVAATAVAEKDRPTAEETATEGTDASESPYQAYIIPQSVTQIVSTIPEVTIKNHAMPATSAQMALLQAKDGKALAAGFYQLFKIANRGRLRIEWTGSAGTQGVVRLGCWTGGQFTFSDRQAPNARSCVFEVQRPISERYVYLLLLGSRGEPLATDALRCSVQKRSGQDAVYWPPQTGDNLNQPTGAAPPAPAAGVGAKSPGQRRVTGVLTPEAEAMSVLESFLSALANQDLEGAYALVAPSSKRDGDPIAYKAALDQKAFLRELSPYVQGNSPQRSLRKFAEYKLGKRRWESPSRFRVFVILPPGDTDEALLVREDGKWYVADPIHIIR